MRDMAFWRLPVEKASLPATKILAWGVELKKCRTPLFDKMVRDHDHRLVSEPEALELHGGRNHGIGLTCSNHMCEQGVVTLKHTPHRMLLVLVQIVLPEHQAVHARQGKMRAVISP